MTYRILTLNHISPKGLARLPRERYQIGADLTAPDAILLRSADMHGSVAPEVRATDAPAPASTSRSPR
jgi:D-3-phosphoglycerate dehydrogenase